VSSKIPLIHKRKDSVNSYLVADAMYTSDCNELTIGLGSVGCDIFGFRPELALLRGSDVAVDIREFEGFQPNHFEGLDRNWVNPDDGEAVRGKRKAGEDVEGGS
jgi:hypothetical protein